MHLRTAALAVALAFAGCSEVRAQSAKIGAGRHEPSREQAYSVRWWARADETFGLPFRPLALAGAAAEPRSGQVFVATDDGRVKAFGPRGKTLWEAEVKGPFNSSPLLMEGRLYVASSWGRLEALDAANGKTVWTYDAGEELVTQPMLGAGLVLVVSSADTVFAVEAATGKWKWQYRRDVPTEFTIRGAGRPMLLDGKVYAGFADGYAVALDASDGALMWAKDLASGKRFADVDAGPVGDDLGHVFFASYATGIHALDAATGATLWTVGRPGTSALLADPASGRLVAGGSGFVAAYAFENGAVKWNLDLGADRAVAGMAQVDAIVMASTGPGPLLFIDAGNGKYRGLFDPGRGVSAPAEPMGSDAVVVSNRGVVYDLVVEVRGRK